MAKVIIPFESFIAHWGGLDNQCLDWLNENVGKCGVYWRADVNYFSVEHADFWFLREQDAIAFKLRWM